MRPRRRQCAAANGIDYYYEISGEGEPLLLLHGGLGSTDMFAPVMPALAEHRQVIAVDLHGHGRTELRDRKIDLVDIGDDMATVLKSLGYDKVDVLGYSFGGKGFQPRRNIPSRSGVWPWSRLGYSRRGSTRTSAPSRCRSALPWRTS